jgi:hypothetical protein
MVGQRTMNARLQIKATRTTGPRDLSLSLRQKLLVPRRGRLDKITHEINPQLRLPIKRTHGGTVIMAMALRLLNPIPATKDGEYVPRPWAGEIAAIVVMTCGRSRQFVSCMVG